MTDLMIINGTVLTLDDSRRIIKDGAVVIEKGRIVDVGKVSSVKEQYDADKVIDARHKIVMPGLIDSHVHNVQMLTRGLGMISISLDGASTGFIPLKL